MKKYLLILVMFLCCFVNAQDVLEVEYDVYTVYDANKSEGFNVTMNGHKLSREEAIRYFTDRMKIPAPFILTTDKNGSNYIEKPTLTGCTSYSYSSTQGNGLYYKNLNENYYMHESVGFGMDRIIKDSIPKIHWPLSRDRKKIMGFDVRKATAMVNKEELTDYLAKDIMDYLRKTYGGYEVPQKYLFIAEDFTVDNGMLTQTMKLKRSIAMKKYGEQLQNLYRV